MRIESVFLLVSLSPCHDIQCCHRRLSIDLVDACWKEHEEWTEIILTNRIDLLGGRSTCLALAAETQQEEFVAHPAIQALLDEVWYGSIKRTDTPYWKVNRFGLECTPIKRRYSVFGSLPILIHLPTVNKIIPDFL